MAQSGKHFFTESEFAKFLVRYYRFFLENLQTFPHSGELPLFTPSLFIRSYTLVDILLDKFNQTFRSSGFLTHIVDTDHLTFDNSQALLNQLVLPLLNLAMKQKEVKFLVLRHKLKRLFAENSGKIILICLILVLAVDFIHVDIHSHIELKDFLQRGSVSIILITLLVRLFGTQFTRFLQGILSYKKDENVFRNRFWRKLTTQLLLSKKPYVIIFKNIDLLSDQKIIDVLKTIETLRSHGILCVAAGNQKLIIATVNSAQTRLKGEFMSQAFFGVNYGEMLFSSCFSLNIFFNKQYVGPTTDSEQANIPTVAFLAQEQLEAAIKTVLIPFVHQFKLNQMNTIGIVESLRIYATLVNVTCTKDLQTLLVFIIASKYDEAWLTATCEAILHPESSKAKPSTTFVCPKLQGVYKTHLDNNKAALQLFYQLSDRDLPQIG